MFTAIASPYLPHLGGIQPTIAQVKTAWNSQLAMNARWYLGKAIAIIGFTLYGVAIAAAWLALLMVLALGQLLSSGTRVVTPSVFQPYTDSVAALSGLSTADLRSLCAEHGIKWRNANGKNKHLSAIQMKTALEQLV